MPGALGVNATVAEQLARAARVAPHVVLDRVKSPALEPTMDTLPKAMVALTALERVTDCGALADPTTVFAKRRLEGLALKVPVAAIPGPASATVCGLLPSES